MGAVSTANLTPDLFPQHGRLWFSNNAHDSIQGDVPWDSINVVDRLDEKSPLDFGFPHCFCAEKSAMNASSAFYDDGVVPRKHTTTTAELICAQNNTTQRKQDNSPPNACISFGFRHAITKIRPTAAAPPFKLAVRLLATGQRHWVRTSCSLCDSLHILG